MLHAEEDAGQCDVSHHAEHGAVGVALDEEGGMLVVIDHWGVDRRAHEAGTEHVPEIDSQEEEPDLPQDVQLLARLYTLLGELLKL